MKRIVLAILDGVGVSYNKYGNAVYAANMENYNSLLKKYPSCLLNASGKYVGLPKGQMGNSEVGHLSIGSGRVVKQSLVKIDDSIKCGDFFKNGALKDTFKHVKDNASKLHIVGLLSDGKVHSSLEHIYALIRAAKKNKVNSLYIHIVTDGRDTLPNVALKYIDGLKKYLKKNRIGKIASICGRYYAMDREENWDRLKKYYDTIVYGNNFSSVDVNDVVKSFYEKDIYDEFFEPVLLEKEGIINDGDGLIIANFRPDRIVQLLKSFTFSDFSNFDVKRFNNLKILSMMPVAENINVDSIFKHDIVDKTLGEILSLNGYKSLRIAEVSKFPHVTHFFDGDKDVLFDKTTFVKIPSVDVKTYDLKPEMSSSVVTDKILSDLLLYDFVLVNYPNGDMVGHTGNFDACVKGLKCVDDCIGKLYEKCAKEGYTLILVADHGNAEVMFDRYGTVLTAHTSNMVRFIVCDREYSLVNGSLSDVAPSILSYCGIEIPKEMSGKIIIKK